MTFQILVVEDEPPILELLKYNLEKEGYNVLTSDNGNDALEIVEYSLPDLIILDWMLPGLSGLHVCKSIRSKNQTKEIPIIMLTAKGEETDKVNGLLSGADDYIVKPFSTKELLARVKSVMRRSNLVSGNEIILKDLTIDFSKYKVKFKNKNIHLGPEEFKLLSILCKRPGRVFSRDQLLDLAWESDIFVEQRTVDVHIRRLRKALGDETNNGLIRTIRGVGYSFNEEEN